MPGINKEDIKDSVEDDAFYQRRKNTE